MLFDALGRECVVADVFQPEALAAFEYAMACLFLAFVWADFAFVLSFALGYLIGLIFHCAHVWPAVRCATWVTCINFASALLMLSARSIFASEAVIDRITDGGLLLLPVSLIYCCWRMAQTAPAFVQERMGKQG